MINVSHVSGKSYLHFVNNSLCKICRFVRIKCTTQQSTVVWKGIKLDDTILTLVSEN